LAPAALFAATRPSRTTALVVLEGYAEPLWEPRAQVTAPSTAHTALDRADVPVVFG